MERELNINFVQTENFSPTDMEYKITTTSCDSNELMYINGEFYESAIQTNIFIDFVKTHPDAILPYKNHPHLTKGDTGYDLFAVETTTIPARGSAVVPVGLKLGYITPGYWFRIEARSGLGFKKHLFPHFGIIDNGFTGDLGVKLYNFSDQDQVIEKGKGVAQFIIYKIENANIRWIDEQDVKETERGEKGFGSSDSK